MSLTLSAQTFTTLYNFGVQPYDGASPLSNVIVGPQGELYGTTNAGGRWVIGTVYQLLPPASAGEPWKETVIHSFNIQGGGLPNAGLLMGPNGTPYGVTPFGTTGYGTAFKLDPPAGTSTLWPYTVIGQFTEADGSPSGGLVFGADRFFLYGVTAAMDRRITEGGTVYSLAPPATAGGAWTQTVLYKLPGASASKTPEGSLGVGSSGGLFGVSAAGGIKSSACHSAVGGCGTVFFMTPPGVAGGAWTEGLLHAFNPSAGDGYRPDAGVIVGPDGVLYGTTPIGGSAGLGTVFSLTPPTTSGEPMTETILHSFTGAPDGCSPLTALALAPNGVLYGTTAKCGANGYGTVFEVAPPASHGGTWTETVLHSFTNGADGGAPNGIALGPDGTIYGTTFDGGTINAELSGGTVFALTP